MIIEFRLPPQLAFSFALTVMLRQKPPQDQALQLLTGCDALAERLLSIMRARGAITRTVATEQATDEAGMFVYPIERTIITHLCGNASYTLWLERMENGHLGCSEDKLWFELRAGDRLVRGDAYLFVGDAFKLRFENVNEHEQIAGVFKEALGLL